MEESKTNPSQIAGYVAISFATIFFILNLFWYENAPSAIFGGILIALVLAVVFGFLNFWFGKLPIVGWGMAFAVVTLTVCGGGEALIKVFDKPAVQVNIDNKTTYVEAPADIEDPALKDYETQKMGFDEDWLGNALSGTWMVFSFSYAITMLINIQLSRKGIRFATVPLNLTIFVIGALVLAKFLWPTGYADEKTVEAQNTAVILGAAGPFFWSLVMQVLYWVIGKGRAIAGKSQFTATVFAAFSYPVFGGIFRLFDVNLFSRLIMSDMLVNTSMTVQLWTELELAGKFVGMFLPAVVSTLISTLVEMFKSNMGMTDDDYED